MEDSILTSTKKALGLDEEDTSFDLDILLFINSVLSTLNQIGVGPVNGYQIEDKSATWDELLNSDPRLNNVKTYTYLRVRLLFDPPATSFAIAAIEKQITELESRINIQVEGEKWS